MGGARVILATAPSAPAVQDMMRGLAVGGRVVLVAAVVEPLTDSGVAAHLLRQGIQGWPSGSAKDSEDTLRFAVQTGVSVRWWRSFR